VSEAKSAVPCALVVMGVSGSGKSTIADKLAERIGWIYEDGDRFHPASNVAKMKAGHPLTDEDRWPWLRAIAAEIDRGCGAREHLVIACSALKRVYRDILVHGRSDVRIVFLNGTQQLIADRLAKGPLHAARSAAEPVPNAGATDGRRKCRDGVDRCNGRRDR
jgi:gluconokinase